MSINNNTKYIQKNIQIYIYIYLKLNIKLLEYSLNIF